MDIISIPKLKLGQLQSLTESTLQITEPIAAIASVRLEVETAFKTFVTGMKKEGATSDKKALDTTRDNLTSGFFLSVKAEEYHPNDDPAIRETMSELRKLAVDPGFRVTKLPYAEETAALDNLVARLKELDLSPLPHLLRWVTLIETANENFKKGSQAYLEELVDEASVDSASEISTELLQQLENLYTMLFAHAKVSGEEPMIRAYAELSELVNSFR